MLNLPEPFCQFPSFRTAMLTTVIYGKQHFSHCLHTVYLYAGIPQGNPNRETLCTANHHQSYRYIKMLGQVD